MILDTQNVALSSVGTTNLGIAHQKIVIRHHVPRLRFASRISARKSVMDGMQLADGELGHVILHCQLRLTYITLYTN